MSTDFDELPTTFQGFSRPNVGWVAQHRDEVRLVDIREPHEWASELTALDDAEKVRMSSLPSAFDTWSKDEPIVLICRSGGRSDAAAAAMISTGFRRVASMSGGMMDWYRQGL